MLAVRAPIRALGRRAALTSRAANPTLDTGGDRLRHRWVFAAAGKQKLWSELAHGLRAEQPHGVERLLADDVEGPLRTRGTGGADAVQRCAAGQYRARAE